MIAGRDRRRASAQGWAIVLGASSGTGAAVAARAARAGLDVVGLHRGRYAEGAEEMAQAVRAAGRRVIVARRDAGTPEGAQAGAELVEAIAGRRSVRLVVHALASGSVGRLASGDATQLHPKQLARTFEAMAHSFVYWAQALVARDLLAPGAQLVGLTNPLGDQLLHNTGAITAAKAALEIYVRHLAVELGPAGHRVNLVRFGTVMTPAVRHVYAPEALARLEAAHRRMIPSGRMCTVEEVAAFVVRLIDGDHEWFNGATIDLTGGMTLRLLDLVLNG